MNKANNIKEFRGLWADARRGLFLLENEIERSYKKDPVGTEFLIKEVARPIKRLLDELNEPVAEKESVESALTLAGSNNFTTDTYERKLKVIIPRYSQLMEAKGYEVTFEVRRVVVAKLMSSEGKSA